jgi:hypothetical protein
MKGTKLFAVTFLLCATAAVQAWAGVTNPDISVIGQPFATITDDPASTDRGRPTLDVGEVEFVFDAYLNPYSKGNFMLSLGEEGIGLEEGTFTLFRGLPGGLSLKGGKYRVGFGKLNPTHPHVYPFGERFRILAAYLPGEESFNETGFSLSEQIPLVGDASLTASLDYLQGDSFRIERESTGDPNDPLATGDGDAADRTRPGVAGRLSSFVMLGEQSALELGISATHGTNNVAAQARTTVFGLDAKAKLWKSAESYVVLQGELLRLDREDASWSPGAGYATTKISPFGGYLFADYNWARRYNAGVSYERYQQPTSEEETEAAIGLFTGYALMEETLVMRLVYDRGLPAGGDAINTFRLHVVYSMGPHKAHQF